jgi:hypothetical protein
MEAKIKQMLGEMHFTIITLQAQLEAALKRIKELEGDVEHHEQVALEEGERA